MNLNGYDNINLVASEGSMHVYRAMLATSGREVLIKVYRPTSSADSDYRNERLREFANLLPKVPGVMPILEAGVIDGDPFWVVPHYEGGSLKTVLESDGPVHWERAVGLTSILAEAVDANRRNHLVNLDIQLANVFLDDEGLPWLDCFDMSNAAMFAEATEDPYAGQTTIDIGSRQYEQSDSYQLGLILLSLLSGQPQAGRATLGADDRLPAGLVPREVPVDVRRVVERSLSQSPGQQAESTSELVRWLDDSISSSQQESEPLLIEHNFVGEEMTQELVVDETITDDSAFAPPTLAPPVAAPSAFAATHEEPGTKRLILLLAGAATLLVAALGATFLLGGEDGAEVNAAAGAPERVDSANVEEVADEEVAVEEVAVEVQGEVVQSAVAETETAESEPAVPEAVNSETSITATSAGQVAQVDATSEPSQQGSASAAGQVAQVDTTSEPSQQGSASAAGQVAQVDATSEPSSQGSASAPEQVAQDVAETEPPNQDSASAIDAASNVSSPPETVISETDNQQPEPTVPDTDSSVTDPAVETAVAIDASFVSFAGPTGSEQTVSFQSTTQGPASTISWDFGDGNSGNGSSVTHTYSSPGSYLVSVVAQGSGVSDSATRTVRVEENSVVAPPFEAGWTASAASSPDEQTLTFRSVTIGDADSFEWYFGDGTTGSGETVSHTYAEPGTYSVKMTAVGPGGSGTATHSVRVDANSVVAPPFEAGWTASPSASPNEQTLNFRSITIGDADSFSWDFGDGSTGVGETIVHTYSEPGTYSVTITASGPGGSGRATHSVRVDPNS